MHAIKHGLNTCIILSPEIVCNCGDVRLNSGNKELVRFIVQDMETDGPSATVPGIVVDVEPRPAFTQRQVWKE